MNSYTYLNDREFLRLFDMENHKEQFLKITILDFQTEKPIGHIEGLSTGGSININGNSNMRRTAQCSLLVDLKENNFANITDIENLISLNKKVKIETGFVNTLASLNYYPQEPIIWFPEGVFIIKNPSVTKNSMGINVSLTLHDKTALLNGTAGGIFPAAVIFSETDLYDLNGKRQKVEKKLIKNIIREIVVEFGEEAPDRIIIEDIPDTIKKLMKWKGKNPVYLTENEGKKSLSFHKDESKNQIEFQYGDNVGYVNEPFTYPGILECAAGDSVASVLDKIKDTLGNYEWFYDIYGFFHFQEKKNYLSNSLSSNILELKETDYLKIENLSYNIYDFDGTNKKLISSISNSPQYDNIKNDFVVWGNKKTVSGEKKPIRYHLAFDNKPDVDPNKKRFGIIYTDFNKIEHFIPLNEGNSKVFGEELSLDKKLYYLNKKKIENETFVYEVYKWNDSEKCFLPMERAEVCYVSTDDWRTEIYYRGLEEDNQTFSKNSYLAELQSEWMKIYNLRKSRSELIEDKDNQVYIYAYQGGFREDIKPENYEFWLDFLEGSDPSLKQGLSQFNVSKIGRRTKVIADKNTNCIFPTEIPNYIYIEADGETSDEVELANKNKQEVIQVSPAVYRNLITGAGQYDAFSVIQDLLSIHTQYAQTVNISLIPIYHLEPNTRISIFDNDMGINGDYIIKTITLPLSPNGTSNISATKCIQKI